MNYELAKELKDAGFPQEQGAKKYRGYQDRKEVILWLKDIRPDINEKGEPTGIEWIVIPTLSELIEACGEGFKKLERLGKNQWRVWGIKNSVLFIDHKTPLITVAKLWLELNKKDE